MTIHQINLDIFGTGKNLSFVVGQFENKKIANLRLKEIRADIKTAKLDYQINVSSSQLIK